MTPDLVDALQERLRRQGNELEKARASEQAARAQVVELEARQKGGVEDERAKAEWKRLQGLIHQPSYLGAPATSRHRQS
ncbi:hypothetical protein T484DRAFT_1810076 [Baffinella frigidus]|nr:hypothetical protein T484DRAFT_1810076 [Cryptophyta sp. CCMP2293]